MSREIRITQMRSGISTKPAQRATLKALGLRRINHTVTHKDNAAVRGMIETVKHLVTIEEIN